MKLQRKVHEHLDSGTKEKIIKAAKEKMKINGENLNDKAKKKYVKRQRKE